jgi:APA family basic amino acid/polyamine antiporter
MAGWISIAVGFAAPIAATAIAMGEYTSQVMIDTGVMNAGTKAFYATVVAIGICVLVSIIHTFNIRTISIFQRSFTFLKIALILVLIIAGFILADSQPVSFLPDKQSFQLVFSAPFAIAMAYVMYSYSGWNASVYIAGEIRNPGKNLPRSLFIGTMIVLVLYVLLNGVFMYSTPVKDMAGKEEVGYIAASYIFGSTGGVIMGILISLGLISAISSMIWAGPRVSMVIGEDISIFKELSYRNKNQVPALAVVVQLVIVIVLILTSTFENIIIYTGFILSLSSFLTVLGVIIMRIKKPDMPRPYKTWGYPYTPVFFLLVMGWMMAYLTVKQPVQSMAVLFTLVTGSIFFLVNQVSQKSKTDQNQ